MNKLSGLFHKSKRQHGERSGLRAEIDNKYAMVLARKVFSTRWADNGFLKSAELKEDFEYVCENAGLVGLANTSHYTYEGLTHEFLASFYNDYREKGNAWMINFTVNQRPYEITYQQFCKCLWIPSRRGTNCYKPV